MQFLSIITNDGCDTIDFLSKSLPNLPNYEATWIRYNQLKEKKDDSDVPYFEGMVTDVRKQMMEAQRRGPHPDLFGKTIVAIVDKAYMDHIAPLVVGMGQVGTEEQRKFVEALKHGALDQINAGIAMAYNTDGVDDATRTIIGEFGNKALWLMHNVHMTKGLGWGPIPLLSPKFLGDVTDMLSKAEPALKYVSGCSHI